MASPQIQILQPLIAERIAAGEVVERPASVVKEAVENSLDAGAAHIEVTLKSGGTEWIEITDDGQGMLPADLELCVCRHATSKISAFDDLMDLKSLGFRGEALPSIAAVSELVIVSRAQLDDATAETHEIRVAQTSPKRATATRVANQNFLGKNHGTRLQIKSLFSQIPARLKFLKSSGTEASAVREILERLALTHPSVSFKLKNDNRILLDLPIESMENRIRRILAENNPFEMVHAKIPGAWSLELFWLKGLSQSNARSIYQVVNGRTLKDRVLQQALLAPLRQSFLPGSFPSLVAILNVPRGELDVNVHPTKTEIRFLEPRKVFALCHAGVQALLEASRPQHLLESTVPAAHRPWSATHGVEPSSREFTLPDFSDLTPSSLPYERQPFGTFRGIFFSTYLVFEEGDELIWIDQHAAHERIRYEKIKNSILNPETLEEQALLVPEVIQVSVDAVRVIGPSLPILRKIGFDAEIFGEASVVFRSIPAVWGNHQLPTRLFNLLDRLQNLTQENAKELVWDETLFEKIAMESCRSSYKAGDWLSESNALELTRKLLACEHYGNCPHGRPTLIRVSKNKVEEWFQRLV